MTGVEGLLTCAWLILSLGLLLWLAHRLDVAPLTTIFLFLWHSFACIGYLTYVNRYGGDANAYYRLALEGDPLWFPGTAFVVSLTSFFVHALGLSKLNVFQVFNLIGTTGLLLLYHVLRQVWPITRGMRRYLPFLVVLLPGLSFWSSAIGKDAPAFLAAALAAYASLDFSRRKLIFALAILLMFLVRPHVAAVMLLSAVAAMLVGRGGRALPRLVLLIVLLAGTYGVLPFVIEYVGLGTAFSMESVKDFIKLRQEYNQTGGGAVDITSMALPAQLLTYLFRPLFFDAPGKMGLIVSFENLLLLVFVVVSLPLLVPLALKKPSMTVCYNAIYTVAALLIFSTTTANLGIAIRQKTMVLPAMFVLLGLSWQLSREKSRLRCESKGSRPDRSGTHVVLIGALPESLVNFRGDLVRTLVASGHRVTAMAAPTSQGQIRLIEELGAAFQEFPVSRSGLSPGSDLETLVFLRQYFRRHQPDVVLAYTVKPVIWSGIALRGSCKARFYALITGLGFAFNGRGLLRKALGGIVTRLYQLALVRSSAVIFQNRDNRATFLQRDLVAEEQCRVVEGSGVNLQHFEVAPFANGAPVFLMIARLLREKGIREYVAAAREIKRHRPDVAFHLLGPEDPSPDGILLDEVQQWHEDGFITYLGWADDVRPFLADCHVYVLPSYHEGMPRTVLEAMATGRPILTTDVPGCRATVEDGANGFLIQKADADSLIRGMWRMLEAQPRWSDMGAASRRLAEARFDVHKVNRELLRIMDLQGVDGTASQRHHGHTSD